MFFEKNDHNFSSLDTDQKSNEITMPELFQGKIWILQSFFGRRVLFKIRNHSKIFFNKILITTNFSIARKKDINSCIRRGTWFFSLRAAGTS